MTAVHRYLVTAEVGPRMDVWVATGMYANWIEGRSNRTDRETWLVTCYDQDSTPFLDVARIFGVTVEELHGTADSERYELLTGEPGTGWGKP